MDKQTFLSDVLSKLLIIQNDRDLKLVSECVAYFIDEGWSPEDVVAYCKCFGEVDPGLDEAVAVNRMEKILNKYLCKALKNMHVVLRQP